MTQQEFIEIIPSPYKDAFRGHVTRTYSHETKACKIIYNLYMDGRNIHGINRGTDLHKIYSNSFDITMNYERINNPLCQTN